MKNSRSLKRLFARQIVRWTLLGFIGSAGLALILAVYLGVESTENHLAITGDAAVKAFRQQILSGEAHESELQIQDAFHLSSHESAVIRDSHFQRVYQLAATSESEAITPTCSVPGKTCWYLGRYQVSTLVPIYFDSSEKELYGYLELNLAPKFDFSLIVGLFFVICAGSLIQGIGLCSRFVRLSGTVGAQLNTWASHIRANPKAPLKPQGVPFDELTPMQDALAGLNLEISRLEDEARDSAKLSIIRGISHDILSPVSQLQKLLAVWTQGAKEGAAPEPELIEAVQRSLRRLTAIAQQTKLLQSESETTAPVHSLDIAQETSTLVCDLQKDAEIEGKQISLSVFEQASGIMAQINAEDYLRIADNLIRNAAHASGKNGKIEVQTLSKDRAPILVVRDQGTGIPKQIQSKIFDLNFTTRPGLGTGLGLAIVKQLCERNRAKISFVSETGVGTEFRVEFRPIHEISEVSV